MAKKPHDNDVAFVKALAELLNDNELTELEVKRDYGEDDSLTVRVSRQVNTVVAAPAPVAAAPAPAPAAAPAASPAPAAASPAPAAAAPVEDPAQHPGALTSPMVGTAYLQPEPGTAAFVSVGDQVSEGQTVMIIEAMKTMNQIAAPWGGTVKRILVEDGTPVEFGAPLMIIE
ncbi:MAG: acetyl-CoA carboxylase biotin carboxyl carrier protein [Paracoccaceae bacterium]